MANIELSWTPVITGNVTAQRVSRRVKSVGGAFSTSGFIPTNDLGTGVNTVTVASTDNVVYEFKLENICAVGGPTEAVGGIIEGIVFACIALSVLSSTEDSVSVNVNLINTDITKVIYTLKKQSDNSIVGGPSTIVIASNTAPKTFTGLDASTPYYIEVELIALVDGVEVISSDAEYNGIVCGGNTPGYKITTQADEDELVPGDGNIIVLANCGSTEHRIVAVYFTPVPPGTTPVLAGDLGDYPVEAGENRLSSITNYGTGDLNIQFDEDIFPLSILMRDSDGNTQCANSVSGPGFANSIVFTGVVMSATPDFSWFVQLSCLVCA